MQEWSDKFSVLISWANLKSILREGGQNLNSKDKILDFCVDIHTSLWFFKIWGGHGPLSPYIGPSLTTEMTCWFRNNFLFQ